MMTTLKALGKIAGVALVVCVAYDLIGRKLIGKVLPVAK
jgi:hypothetical protein